MPSYEISMLALIGLLAFTLLIVMRYLGVNRFNPEGRGAHKKTTRALKKFGLIRGFKVISGVRFAYKGKAYEIENMLIGRFGILAIHTLGGRGEYYGELNGDNWSRVLDEQRTVFQNPLKPLDEAVYALRAVFSAEKIYNIPIEALIVLTNRSGKTKLCIKHGNRILPPGKLGGYLGKAKFEIDAGIDIAKVTEAIKQAFAE